MRYLIFGSCTFYASGGGGDYISGRESIEGAKDLADGLLGKRLLVEDPNNEHFDPEDPMTVEIDWVHVFDMVKEEVVYEIGGQIRGLRENLWSDLMPKLSVSELLRRACIYAEDNQENFIEAYGDCPDEDGQMAIKEAEDFLKQLREYRRKRWGGRIKWG